MTSPGDHCSLRGEAPLSLGRQTLQNRMQVSQHMASEQCFVPAPTRAPPPQLASQQMHSALQQNNQKAQKHSWFGFYPSKLQHHQNLGDCDQAQLPFNSTLGHLLPNTCFPLPITVSPSGTASPLLMTSPNPTILWGSGKGQKQLAIACAYNGLSVL